MKTKTDRLIIIDMDSGLLIVKEPVPHVVHDTVTCTASALAVCD